jgi:hypothetical protein
MFRWFLSNALGFVLFAVLLMVHGPLDRSEMIDLLACMAG